MCDYGVVSDSESRIFLKYEIINVLFAAIHLQWIDSVCVRAALSMCAMCAMCGSCLAHFHRRCGCLFRFCFRNFNCKNNKIKLGNRRTNEEEEEASRAIKTKPKMNKLTLSISRLPSSSIDKISDVIVQIQAHL